MITTNYGDMLLQMYGVLVQGVNCQGVMRSGIAKQIRSKYPIVYDKYRERHIAQGGFTKLGSVQYVQVCNLGEHPLIIVNAATQEFYGRDTSVKYVDYNAISSCFAQINEFLLAYETEHNFKLPLHFPAIGCGLANGEWSEVSTRIDSEIDDKFSKTLWLYK